MLLRTRITLIVALALVLTVLGLSGAGLLREQLLQQRLAATALAGQESLWSEMLANEERLLNQSLDKLAGDAHFLQAARQADAEALAQSLRELGLHPGPEQPFALVAVMDARQEPLWLGEPLPRPLLDTVSMDRAWAGDLAAGLHMRSGSTPLVLATRVVRGPTGSVLLVLGRHARYALQRFALRTDATASLLDLRGNLGASTDAVHWNSAGVQVSSRVPYHGQQGVAARTYTVSSTPLLDIAGSAAGALVTLEDETQEADASRFLGRSALAGTLVLVLAVLWGLNFYLGRSFRPLDKAIAALQALARGDASVRLQYAGDDEIGRIAQAVVAFRRSAQELASSQALRERVRRRQEHLIRTQLQHLADATDMTSREEVLRLLTHSQSPASGAAHGDEELLRQLALVMGDLTQRIIHQHQRLSSMIVDLREALVSKTRLAGLQQELQIAAQVQLSILPRTLPTDVRAQMHCHITPAREVGGDFYDYFEIDHEHLGFVIADVSGKGVPAALFMAIARTLLKATALFVTSPTSCMRKLNDLLAAENEQMMFVTVFYGVLHLPSGRVAYVNAGHNPPYLLRAGGQVEPVARTGGIAVAVSEGFVYREGVLDLAPGDTLFLYTDGITEAFDPDGQEYSDARLQRLLGSLAEQGLAPAELSAAVLEDVHLFERGAPQADDITCMSLRYQGCA